MAAARSTMAWREVISCIQRFQLGFGVIVRPAAGGQVEVPPTAPVRFALQRYWSAAFCLSLRL